MGLAILVLLVGIPLIEIAVFIEVGGVIGLWPTIAIVIATAVLGTALLRRQGLATLQRAQTELAAQRLPVKELFDGICLLVGGALLLTPGFVTDACGLALLIPPLRAILGRWLWQLAMRRGNLRVDLSGSTGGPSRDGPSSGGPTIIEGDYSEVPRTPDDRPEDGARAEHDKPADDR